MNYLLWNKYDAAKCYIGIYYDEIHPAACCFYFVVGK